MMPARAGYPAGHVGGPALPLSLAYSAVVVLMVNLIF